jgi:hypothetical protein
MTISIAAAGNIVVAMMARSAVHRIWSLGCWSYLQPNCGHGTTLMRLQISDTVFSTGNEIMRPAYNFEPMCTVIMLTREEWTKGPESPPVVKRLVWYTDVSRRQGGGRGRSL